MNPCSIELFADKWSQLVMTACNLLKLTSCPITNDFIYYSAQPSCDRRSEWTRFYDQDNPSGRGDYELLRSLSGEYPRQICASPSAIDVRVTATNADYRTTGQIVTANTTIGFYCSNRQQGRRQGRCQDYKIRFCCPKPGKKFCFWYKTIKVYRYIIFECKNLYISV